MGWIYSAIDDQEFWEALAAGLDKKQQGEGPAEERPQEDNDG